MPITRHQREALRKLYLRTLQDQASNIRFALDSAPLQDLRKTLQEVKRWPTPPGYRTFRRAVHHGHGCLMVHVAGIWIGVEPDGYTHS